MRLVPLGDRVVLKQVVAEETTKSGIVLTGQTKEKPQQAEVVAVGPGGIVDGKETTFTIPIKQLHALAFTANEEFECYYGDELYYFYPKVNKLQCAKWAVIVDLLNKEENTYGK